MANFDEFSVQNSDLNESSLAGLPPGQEPINPSQDGTLEDPNGMTVKEIMAEQIMQVPIEQLIQLVQSMPPEELAQMIQQLYIQQGMSQEEAIANSITLMKVIYERIQTETGQPITDFTGQISGQTDGQNAAPQQPNRPLPEPSLAGQTGGQMGGQNGL